MQSVFVFLALAAGAGTPADLPDGGSPPRAELERLELELRDSPLAVKFTNITREPILILKPLDGSEWCWIMPHYKLTVINEHGREIPYVRRCKLFGHPYTGTKWPDDYVVVIPAGGSYTHRLRHNHAVPGPGRYRLRFEYVFTPKADRTPGGPYPAGLWRGRATSNTLETRLEPGR